MVNRPSLYNNILACILKGRQVQIQSYQVTTNGSFAIIHALVTDPDAGVMARTPAVGILEFSQGKISAETWLL